MTVGTGYGVDGYKKLANGLLTSIDYNSPSKVVFFVTEKSCETVDYLKELYYEKIGEKLDSYELVNVTNPDDFSTCYKVMSQKIDEYSDNKIIVDYTSGTKTMSVTIAVIAILNHIGMMSIIGSRGELGVIEINTEENKSQNPYRVYDKMYFDSFKKHFNNFRFESAKISLSKIVSFEKDDLNLLFEINKLYNEWDKFHHEIPKLDSKNELLSNIKLQFQLNSKALNIITHKGYHKEKNFYLVADMLNNARRRFEEGRYDDATARLYRSLELIAQKLLSSEYELNTSDISMNQLKEKGLDETYLLELEKKENSEGKIKLGLRDSYYLLDKLGNEVGKYYIQKDNQYLNILSIRNFSILAHGEIPVSKENYLQFEELVYDISKIYSPKIDQFLMETKFPKF